MDFESDYEIARTVEYIHGRNFTKVALQFPDEHLKNATKVVSALRNKLCSVEECGSEDATDVRLFVMADTTYGSCCVDEVGASHIGADCVIHYGHTCFSPTSTLPALFVFGKAPICVADCVKALSDSLLPRTKPVLVLYGLEYAHAIEHVKEALAVESEVTFEEKLQFADIMSTIVDPAKAQRASNGYLGVDSGLTDNGDLNLQKTGSRYSIGGLTWNLPQGHKMEDYLLLWIGSDNSAFANVTLTFNGCEIVRYDATGNNLVTDVSQQRRILKRRYYLVEKAKDANIVGILVGTLGVAGYFHMIRQMKELITSSGRKAYTFVMGRPNPAKLANFPECDVFIYVSCAQTALLDSKEYLAPVITPFEALLAYNRGSQWTGAYTMEFRDLMISPVNEVENHPEEARYSFLRGGYVEDFNAEDNGEEDGEGSLALVHATERALQVRENNSQSLRKATIRSGAEFLSTRSYQGLDIQSNSAPSSFIVGRTGRASAYKDENRQHENT